MSGDGRAPGASYAEVIGDPVTGSKSPAIHRFWLGERGINAHYGATTVERDGLADYFAERRNDPAWRGCNVTMPHKQAVMYHLDALDPLAKRIGAVNTVVKGVDGTLKGHNTDAAGFLEPLSPYLARHHLFRMARVLGTGGAARAVVAALADQGFTMVLAGRDPEKARALLDELAPGKEHYAVHLTHFSSPTDFAFDEREGCLDLVVNATPLGMSGQVPLAFDWSHAPPGAIAFDLVTDPAKTPFLEDAQKHGFRIIEGLEMLIGQAAIAFELFFGAPAPREGRQAVREQLQR
jgi:shikimate dehydrogenase